MTLGVNGPLVPTREHPAAQLACPGELLLVMGYDDAGNGRRRPLSGLHYYVLGGHLDRLLLQLQQHQQQQQPQQQQQQQTSAPMYNNNSSSNHNGNNQSQEVTTY